MGQHVHQHGRTYRLAGPGVNDVSVIVDEPLAPRCLHAFPNLLRRYLNLDAVLVDADFLGRGQQLGEYTLPVP